MSKDKGEIIRDDDTGEQEATMAYGLIIWSHITLTN